MPCYSYLSQDMLSRKIYLSDRFYVLVGRVRHSNSTALIAEKLLSWRYTTRAPTTLKSEGEVTSLSGADKREVRDNREKW